MPLALERRMARTSPPDGFLGMPWLMPNSHEQLEELSNIYNFVKQI
jgi:hypothetical protein